jgi:hypothetical protein
MSKKGWDVVSFIFLAILLISFILPMILIKSSSFNSIFATISIFNFVIIPLAFAYTIAIIVLAIRIDKGIVKKIFMIIASLIIVGVIPLIYYFFDLRKILKQRENIGAPVLSP